MLVNLTIIISVAESELRVYTRIMSASCYCILLRKVSRKLTARYDAALEPFGIGVAQFSLLRTIRREGEMSVTFLAEEAELDRSTVGRNCKLLLKSGLIEAVKGADQREAVYTLSDKGSRLLERADPVWAETQKEIELGLSPGQIETLERLLEIA